MKHTKLAKLGALTLALTMGFSLTLAMGAQPQVNAATGPANWEQARQAVVAAATDYYVLAQQLLPKAQSGDAASQYSLWEMHHECYDLVGGGRSMSWDEAQQQGALIGASIDETKKVYNQCNRFIGAGDQFRDAMVWLQRATDAKYPRAEVMTAELRLTQERLKMFHRAGAVSTGYGLLPPIGGNIDPHALVLDAVKSLDPVVLEHIGDIQALLNPSLSIQENESNRAAWTYVACHRGVNCAAYGPISMVNDG